MEHKGLKFLVVMDGHPLFQHELREVLKSHREHSVVLECENSEAAQDLIRREGDLDLVLLDLHTPQARGLNTLESLLLVQPALNIIAMSSYENRDEVVAAMQCGAKGFISRVAPPAVLRHAIDLVLSGEVYLPSNFLLQMVRNAEMSTPVSSVSFSVKAKEALHEIGITDRQVEVLGLMARGDSNKHIANTLNLAENTVKVHVAAILKTLNLNSRTQVVATLAKFGARFH
jgi:DNA-binding NarL/FixJ family response regulator